MARRKFKFHEKALEYAARLEEAARENVELRKLLERRAAEVGTFQEEIVRLQQLVATREAGQRDAEGRATALESMVEGLRQELGELRKKQSESRKRLDKYEREIWELRTWQAAHGAPENLTLPQLEGLRDYLDSVIKNAPAEKHIATAAFRVVEFLRSLQGPR
jgi:DNA repair exonuclease SbcCD ATPase subunit